MKRYDFIAWLLLLSFAVIAPAHAYVGPGPGLSMVGSLFTLIGGIILAFFMVLLYPFRLLYKKLKGNKGKVQDDKSA